jgi:tetratricopeptide (TPR) repeat protein
MHSRKDIEELLGAGDIDRSVAICEVETCVDCMSCQKMIAWSFYRQSRWLEAQHWFLRAAANSDGEALFGLGSSYWNQKSYPTSFEYFEQAAKLGYDRAWYRLAAFYQHGLGRPIDLNHAKELYAESAKHGYLIAERGLIHIELHENGIGTRIAAGARLIFLLIKAAFIALHDSNDRRLLDVPNPLGRKK